MQTTVRLMVRLICTIRRHTGTGQLYVTVISTIHAITATGKLYAEAGYEYSSDRSSIPLKMYALIQRILHQCYNWCILIFLLQNALAMSTHFASKTKVDAKFVDMVHTSKCTNCYIGAKYVVPIQQKM